MSRELSDTQRAVVELRQHRQMTQQAFAVHLGIAITTVARWETFRPPRGPSLVRLKEIADEFGRPDLARRFQVALNNEKLHIGSSERDPLAPHIRALIRVYGQSGRLPTAAKAYRAVLRAITKAHGEVLREITAKHGPSDDWDWEADQLRLEQLDDEQELKEKKKS